MVMKLHVRNIFTGSTTPPGLAKLLVTRILTRDLFSVANLLVYCCFCKFDFAAVAVFFRMLLNN